MCGRYYIERAGSRRVRIRRISDATVKADKAGEKMSSNTAAMAPYARILGEMT
jgi:hypothetical protein